MKTILFAVVSGLAIITASEVNAQNQGQSGMKAPTSPHKSMHPKHPVHKHHAHRHHYHHHHHYHYYSPEEHLYEIEYYGGHLGCPYRYHGSYFWYPHPQGNLLRGYAPYLINGMYWYPSRMHPHAVYVERSPMVLIHPFSMNAIRVDSALYNYQYHPMERKWASAPVVTNTR